MRFSLTLWRVVDWVPGLVTMRGLGVDDLVPRRSHRRLRTRTPPRLMSPTAKVEARRNDYHAQTKSDDPNQRTIEPADRATNGDRECELKN